MPLYHNLIYEQQNAWHLIRRLSYIETRRIQPTVKASKAGPKKKKKSNQALDSPPLWNNPHTRNIPNKLSACAITALLHTRIACSEISHATVHLPIVLYVCQTRNALTHSCRAKASESNKKPHFRSVIGSKRNEASESRVKFGEKMKLASD